MAAFVANPNDSYGKYAAATALRAALELLNTPAVWMGVNAEADTDVVVFGSILYRSSSDGRPLLVPVKCCPAESRC